LTTRYPKLDPMLINIYKGFQHGRTYVAASDTSHGVGRDYSVTGVMDCQTGEVVADIMNNRIDSDDFTIASMNMLDVYCNPKWWIEDNDWGRQVINAALRYKYPTVGYYDLKRTKPGFHTDESTRRDLINALIAGVNNRQVVPYNAAGVKQLYDLIRNAQKNGRIEAVDGGHDDYAIMLGILCLKREGVVVNMTRDYAPIHTVNKRRYGRESRMKRRRRVA